MDEKKELLLREYEEIGQCWRHDDSLATQWTAALFPLAVGAFVLSITRSRPAILPAMLCVSGILMMLYWLFYYLRIYRRMALRYQRAKEIERELGFQHHCRFDQPGISRWVPNLAVLRIIIFIIYVSIWVTRLVWF